jgi:hypothetical protein
MGGEALVGTQALRRVTPIGRQLLQWGKRTYVMGIVNATPDSFSDGGDALQVDQARASGLCSGVCAPVKGRMHVCALSHVADWSVQVPIVWQFLRLQGAHCGLHLVGMVVRIHETRLSRNCASGQPSPAAYLICVSQRFRSAGAARLHCAMGARFEQAA